ncbi:hypothetical protein X551_02451 [Methylibium sp. T29]|nr:hypothetical protein X551_02451 [Methylibium sp. T29]
MVGRPALGGEDLRDGRIVVGSRAEAVDRFGGKGDELSGREQPGGFGDRLGGMTVEPRHVLQNAGRPSRSAARSAVARAASGVSAVSVR